MKTKYYNNQVVRKRFGQNFLKDDYILEQIVEKAQISKDDFVLEIGPGHGVLTERLLTKAKEIVAVEIDRDLVAKLQVKFKDTPNLKIVSQDILDFDLNSIDFTNYDLKNRKAIGNIPYYITTPIIMKIINEKSLKTNGISQTDQIFSELVIMLQKEVGQRMIAKAGTKEYGALSVIAQYACHVKPLMIVKNTSFYPQPKVDSMVVSLTMKTEDEYKIDNPKIFWRIVHGVFVSRRKTLRNSLKMASFSEETIVALEKEFDLTIRGETMDLTSLSILSNLISKIELP